MPLRTRVDKMNLKATSADISEYNDIHFSTSQQLLLLFASQQYLLSSNANAK